MRQVEDETLFFHTELAALGVIAASPDAGRFTDIPTSPWLHSSHWITSSALAQQLPDVHPLLGVHVELLSGRDHVWQHDIGAESLPWLADHRVGGRAVLPVASFVEVALAAGREALSTPIEAVQVTEFAVEQTLTLDCQTQVTTQLTQTDDGTRVEVHARPAGGTWSRYAVASIDVVSGLPAPSVEAGSGWSEHDIALPDQVADHPHYCIHPVLLDTALRQLVAAVPAGSETDYLPASAATIRVYRHSGRRARCHTELTKQGDGDFIGRIILTDDAGTPTVELTGIRLRPMDPGALPLPLERKIFGTEWVAGPDEGGPAETGSAPTGSWLLLADPDPETAAETRALVAGFSAKFSSPTRRVISAELSEGATEAVAQIATDPESPLVGVIVFVGKRSFDGTDVDGTVGRARELVLAISAAARAAANGDHKQSPRLWLVTRDGLAVSGDENGDPVIGTLKGLIRTWRFPGELARVLADEPDLGATLVDLDGAADRDDLVETLIGELGSSTRDDVIAWRSRRRYTERLSRVTMNTDRGGTVVRADGSYLLTGGLGGLGTVVARWLVERGAGRLILNGRSELSDAQRSVLAELEAAAEVVYVRGDISSAGVAERLVAAAEESGRPLRGVIHAAGVLGEGLVEAVTRENLERVWSAKVVGALRLHAVTASRQLDWWVGFSSMAALLGLPGQAAYATANAWLDALAAWRHASGLPATAIDWGQWSDVGIGRSLSLSVLDPITPDEGVEALDSLVGGDFSQVGVGRLRLDRAVATTPEFRQLGYFAKLLTEFDTPAGASTAEGASTVDGTGRSAASAPDWSQMPAEDRLSELMTRLRAILARELRTPASAVDVRAPFPELGLDSMMAMTVLKETQQLVGVSLSASMFWNHPTISALSTYLVAFLAPPQVPRGDSGDEADLVDSTGGVLDELFDHVESASTDSGSGVF
ncbi:MAG: type I polyketide synthase [Mycobacterium sp.]